MNSVKKYLTCRRLIAFILCFCLIATMGGGNILTVVAETKAGPTANIVAGTRVADPDTMDDYKDRLLSNANGSRYAGRVWTDKTVFAYGDSARNSVHFTSDNTIKLDMASDGYDGSVNFNADFAHVFSTLASSQVINEYPPSPVDLVITFDMSASMGQDTRFGLDGSDCSYQLHNTDTDTDSSYEWPAEGVIMDDRIANSRVQMTLDAINTTIDKLMQQNPQNRVAVCGYGANAVVLMPLAHYKKNGDTPYLTVGGMETLYHPGDLVWRDKGDQVDGKEVKTSGWYWVNNRDTCYTVVVNAKMNNYTEELDQDGSGQSHGPDFAWKNLTKTVSNNALDYNGDPVKAFPGIDYTLEDNHEAEIKAKSKEIHNDPGKYAARSSELKEAMAKTTGLKADDYVGYFTNTQGGIYLAYKQLADSEATTYSEDLTTGVTSTVARIPAVIVMSDGGVNFAFNEMGPKEGDYSVKEWNSRYGEKPRKGTTGPDITDDSEQWYMNDNNYDAAASEDGNTDPVFGVEGREKDFLHRLGEHSAEGEQAGDEWYKVYLPGNDTLAHDGTAEEPGNEGYWKGLEGLYNTGADYYQDGTLSTPPDWNRAGVFYSSNNDLAGTGGTIVETLLTASYMSYVANEHYSHGWKNNNATADSCVPLSTYTMNVDTMHVPQWGRWRLYPTLDPKEYSLDDIGNNDSSGWGGVGDAHTMNPAKDKVLAETYGGESWGQQGSEYLGYGAFTGLKEYWNTWKSGTDTNFSMAQNVRINVYHLPEGHTYNAAGDDAINVTNENVIANVAYNDEFYDVTSGELSNIFDEILALIVRKVFVPVSGDNDAGVGNSITYQDPIGEYMEIKNGSIIATPYHTDGTIDRKDPVNYDMAMLLFGEMHGLARAGVYDFHWNDEWMAIHRETEQGEVPFQQGWYNGPVATAKYGGADSVPTGEGIKKYANATQARADGWIYRLNFETVQQYVPIIAATDKPENLSQQTKNTVYTVYRFECSSTDRDMLRRNPIYGEVTEEVQNAWEEALAKWRADNSLGEGKYPNNTYDILEEKDYPGLYRLNDIRVWQEDTGDYVDTDGAIAPNSGYERSLYVNVPATAVPTQLATVTLGKDGVLSYTTNLGSDYEKIVKEAGGEETFDEETYKNYCYQSTPLRLFYAVGLTDDVIFRDESGGQLGVDFNAISAEYIDSHTVPGQDYVWFISNFYSNTAYGDYVTDSTGSRTRGDPTVTFSPSSDNRYYVFQKPLPLYAHAYRVQKTSDNEITLQPVDDPSKENLWTAEENRKGGNGSTVWEGAAAGVTGGGSWAGGEYMGTYTSETPFKKALNEATEADGIRTITDSHNTKYRVVENGIVFLEQDVMDHVTSENNGDYAPGSVAFSSNDYFFILLEYYVPDGGIGTNLSGKDVAGTQKGHMVQRVVARKGSEFGSAFASQNIDNGDMLCWTTMQGNIATEFPYLSRTDTGDNTRGEPTWEKLTKKDTDLKKYLQSCGITNEKQVPNPAYISPEETPEQEPTIGALDQQVKFWTDIQNDTQVKAALAAADEGGGLTEAKFKEKFKFAVAARPGGIRTGDMSNNRQAKADNNPTSTAYSYYLPTISDNSGTDDSVIINNYLGNNGRLEIANQRLHVTKLLDAPDGYELTDALKNITFDYQIYVQGVSGERTATLTQYNEYSKTWERRLAYIDVLTDNSDLVVDNDSNRALFVLDDAQPEYDLAKQVIAVATDDGTEYYYANEDGTLPTIAGGAPDSAKKCESTDIYYLYLPPNGTSEDAQHTRRLYQDPAYDATAESYNRDTDFAKNGITTFFKDGDRDETSSEPGAENRDSYRKETDGRPAGTKTYWAMDTELIPVDEVRLAETIDDIAGSGDGPAALALESISTGTWSHSPGTECTDDTHKKLRHHTFVIRRPNDKTSLSDFSSPFKTRTLYMTTTLDFGGAAELYDDAIPKSDLFTGKSKDDIAANTAEFTLKHGEGLLLTGLDNRIAYRFTEKLSDTERAAGYKLKQVNHVQESGGTTYTPGGEAPPEWRDGVYSVFGSTSSFEEQVHFINTFTPGDIAITKELAAAAGVELTEQDKSTGFSFTLQLEQEGAPYVPLPVDLRYTISGPGPEDTPTEGKLPAYTGTAEAAPGSSVYAVAADAWAFTLQGGQTLSVTGLPAGVTYTYTITEAHTDGYTTTAEIVGAAAAGKVDSNTVTGTVMAESKASVVFTNTKREPDPAFVDLALTKTIASWNETYDITDDVYAIKQDAFAFNIVPSAANPSDDPIKTLPGYKNGVLTVKNGAPAEGSPNTAAAAIFSDLAFSRPGTYAYTVTEQISDRPGISTDSAAYAVTVRITEDTDGGHYTGRLKADILINGEPLAASDGIVFINRYDKDKISVPLLARKEFDGEMTNGQFTFELVGVSAATGESAYSGSFLSALWSSLAVPAADEPASLEAPPGPDYTEVPPAAGPWKQRNDQNGLIDFGTITFEQPGVYVYELRELPGDDSDIIYSPVVYTITYTVIRADGALQVESVTYEASESVGAPRDVPFFVNARKTGELVVSKQVTGDAGEKGKDFNFTVAFTPTTGLDKVTVSKNGEPQSVTLNDGKLEFTLRDDETLQFSGLPVGTHYTVTEDDYTGEGYTTSSSGEEGDITADGTAAAEFTNSRGDEHPPYEDAYGDLSVTKRVTGSAGETDKIFLFTVEFTPTTGLDKATVSKNGAPMTTNINGGKLDFTLRDGETLEIRDLPEGVKYSVTEDDYTGAGYTTSSSGATGTITADSTAKAEFVNNKDGVEPPPDDDYYGDLTVAKTVTGQGGDTGKAWHFRVELSDSSINGRFGDMYFDHGIAEFTLRHGQSITAEDLPDDVAYTVTEAEADQDGYTTAASGNTGVIPADGTARAEFVNDKDGSPQPPGNPGNEPGGNPGDEPPGDHQNDSDDQNDSNGSHGSNGDQNKQKDDTSDTGDNSHLAFWLALLPISAAGVALTRPRRRQKRWNN